MKKEMLTLEKCKKDINSFLKKYVVCFVFAFCFCAMIAYSYYFEYGATPLFYMELFLLALILFWAVSFLFRNCKKVSSDEFVIVSDTLLEKKNVKITRADPEYRLCFSKYGSYDAPQRVYCWHEKKIKGKRLYDTSMEGDGFYLILEKDTGGEILVVYNKKYFDLSGELSARVVG